jgi:hypothetical protein
MTGSLMTSSDGSDPPTGTADVPQARQHHSVAARMDGALTDWSQPDDHAGIPATVYGWSNHSLSTSLPCWSYYAAAAVRP